jgi:hypothetical protein
VVIFWRIRRRQRAAAPGAWMEATCPACIGVSLIAERVPGLAGLTRLDPADPAGPVGPASAAGPAGQQDAGAGAASVTDAGHRSR